MSGPDGIAMSRPADGGPADIALRTASVAGAIVGYGCLAAFVWLISLQTYRWFRDGEWTHFGISEGLRMALLRLGVSDTGTGHLTALAQWLDAPTSWLGLHKVLDVVPASLTLFAASILGNCLFIYCGDRLAERENACQPSPP